MAGIVYGLCALTAFLCSTLLLQAYRRSQYKLLLWGGVCFAGLTCHNLLVVIDKNIGSDVDLSILRLVVSLSSMLILLYGIIWDTETD